MVGNFGNNMREYKFIIYQDKKKEFRFRILAPNGRIVADSGEGYKTLKGCKKNIEKLQVKLPNAKIIDNEDK